MFRCGDYWPFIHSAAVAAGRRSVDMKEEKKKKNKLEAVKRDKYENKKTEKTEKKKTEKIKQTKRFSNGPVGVTVKSADGFLDNCFCHSAARKP